MNALDKIRRQGYVLRPANDELYIEPIDALTASQRRWLIDNKSQILADLSAERWNLFLALVQEHGISRAEVEARFTPDDISDLVSEPDDQLPLHAQTLARHIKHNRTPQERINHQIATSGEPALVRAIHARRTHQTCGSCRHFALHEYSRNLGSCQIKAQPEAACGLWNNDNRSYCSSWVSS